VQGDGTIEGFIGGVCAQHSVRLYSLTALASGAPLLLRILPGADGDAGCDDPNAVEELSRDEGAVTIRNPCLSGGAIEIFLEPVLPAPRVLVAGNSPIVAALRTLGPEVGLEVVAAQDVKDAILAPAPGDLALVVAAHGDDEVATLRAGLEVGVRYVGLVASRKRGAAVIDELRSEGVAEELLGVIETPAGIRIGARTPAETALAIIARIVEVRRGGSDAELAHTPATPVTAVDPICGMTVVVSADTPSAERAGEVVYFCSAACKRSFEERREPARSDG
jgi:xanthine dehydrogenase accessory factor